MDNSLAYDFTEIHTVRNWAESAAIWGFWQLQLGPYLMVLK